MRARPGPVQRAPDPAEEAARQERAARTAQWMNVALRPDLHPLPVQARPAEGESLERNAERDAAALLDAFQGLGTDEDAVFRVLNQPPEVVQTIRRVYDEKYNRHTGAGLVEDLRDEFDHLASNEDWAFVIGQLARAGISVPDEYASHHRQDPAADLDRRARIVARPGVRTAVPGTRIAYAFAHGAQQMHGPGTGYSYQWYLLHDPTTSRDRPARIEGPAGPRAELTAEVPGNHKVICKVERAGKKGVAPAFHEYPLTIVPESQRAADALAQTPEGQDPGRELALTEAYLAVLREAEQQPGSAPLDPKTAAAYEKHIAAMKKRLASTEGAERIPIRAVHVDRETARVSPLRAFVSHVGTQGERETWRLVDITNPESRRLSGEYDGSGEDARRAILAALATWNERNRYPTGRIELDIGLEAAGEPIAHGFQTDGQSFWDSVAEFFAEVGFWAGMGALAAGVVTAVAPVPGSRAVSTLVWTSILGSTVATGIEATQRHAEGMSTARDDAMDALTIAGNILAGAWMRQARVLVGGQGGTRIGTGILIGQLGTDSVQGIVLGVEHLAQYERILAIEDPEQRTRAMMELLRSAATAATLVVVSAQGAKSDLDRLGNLGPQGNPTRLGNHGEPIGPEISGPDKRQDDGSPEASSRGASDRGPSTKQVTVPESVRRAAPGLEDFLASGAMSTKGCDALLALALAAPTDELIRSIVQKVIAHGDLPNMDRWLIQAARQRGNPGRLLDLQASLDDAIRLRQAGEGDVALEVFYSEGRKLTSEHDIAASRNKANIDVVTDSMRREWKRVNRPITNEQELLGQIKDARLKFRKAGLRRGANGQKNVGMVDFGDQLTRGAQGWEWARERILRFLARDRMTREYLDELVVRVDGVEHVFQVR